MGALGLALDGAHMYAQQQMARAAADAGAQAAVLSMYRGTNVTAPDPFGVGGNPAAFTCSTTDGRTPCVYARLNGFGGIASDVVTVSFPTVIPGVSNLSTGGVAAVAVSIQRSIPTGLIRFIGPSTSTIVASATAALIRSGPDCITVLSPTANGALSVSNNATLSLHNCGLTVNSAAPQALIVNNNGILQSDSIEVVGGYLAGNNSTISPTPLVNAPPAADPFAGVPAPTYSTPPCFQNTIVTNNATAVLGPGVYCGGITVSNNASVSFNPGVYILLGGGLNVSNNGTLTGQNITFYNTFDATHPFAPINLSNNTTATLSATISGALQGMLFFEDRNAPLGYTQNFDNNSSQILVGVLYFPRSRVLLSNNGSLGHRNMAIVANTVQLSNNASLLISLDVSEAGAPQVLGIALVR